jgi:hypothetical protein
MLCAVRSVLHSGRSTAAAAVGSRSTAWFSTLPFGSLDNDSKVQVRLPLQLYSVRSPSSAVCTDMQRSVRPSLDNSNRVSQGRPAELLLEAEATAVCSSTLQLAPSQDSKEVWDMHCLAAAHGSTACWACTHYDGVTKRLKKQVKSLHSVASWSAQMP